MDVIVDGSPLRIEDVAAVAPRLAEARAGDGVAERMAPAHRVVSDAVANGDVVYGITTGFGAFASTRIDHSEARDLQVNLLRSHAGGVGDLVPDEVDSAMRLLRHSTLAQGHSGVRPGTVQR